MSREIEQSLSRSTMLRNKILRMAFEGRLCSQVPNDEPAEILLERIRRERELINPAVKKKPKFAKRKNHGDIKQMRLI